MSDDIKHAKITTPTQLEDGSTQFTTESFYEQLSHRMVEIEKHMHINQRTVLKHLIKSIDVISKEGTPVLTITIKSNKNGPFQLTKRWLVSKESFGKK